MSARSRSTEDASPQQLVAVLRAQLEQGERLAWATWPEPAAFEPKGDGRNWDAAAILGGGYAMLGACAAALFTGRWQWLSIPIGLGLCGLVAYWIASWIKARARRAVAGTVYGLSTRRALILRTYPALAVQTLPIEAIADITLVDKRRGFADLSLDAASGAAGLLVFRGVLEPERARVALMRVVRDPVAADEELAGTEAYAEAIRQLLASAQ